MRINATGGPEALTDTLVNVKFSSTGWTPDDKVRTSNVLVSSIIFACGGPMQATACTGHTSGSLLQGCGMQAALTWQSEQLQIYSSPTWQPGRCPIDIP